MNMAGALNRSPDASPAIGRRRGSEDEDDLNMRDSGFDPMGRSTPDIPYNRKGQPIDNAERLELSRKLGQTD